MRVTCRIYIHPSTVYTFSLLPPCMHVRVNSCELHQVTHKIHLCAHAYAKYMYMYILFMTPNTYNQCTCVTIYMQVLLQGPYISFHTSITVTFDLRDLGFGFSPYSDLVAKLNHSKQGLLASSYGDCLPHSFTKGCSNIIM